MAIWSVRIISTLLKYLIYFANTPQQNQDRVDLHSPYCRYLRHSFVGFPQVQHRAYGYTTDQLIESFYFTIGLVTQWNLLSKVRHIPPYFFRETKHKKRHLLVSTWAWYLIPIRFYSRYQSEHSSHPSWLLRWTVHSIVVSRRRLNIYPTDKQMAGLG